MSRLLSSVVALAFVASLGASADAKSCRGANGKFIKCPKTTASTPGSMMGAGMTKDAKGKCHGANGRYVKCSK